MKPGDMKALFDPGTMALAEQHGERQRLSGNS